MTNEELLKEFQASGLLVFAFKADGKVSIFCCGQWLTVELATIGPIANEMIGTLWKLLRTESKITPPN